MSEDTGQAVPLTDGSLPMLTPPPSMTSIPSPVLEPGQVSPVANPAVVSPPDVLVPAPSNKGSLSRSIWYRKSAEALWQLLDDIDTLSDVHKGNLQSFQNAVLRSAHKRFKLFSSDGYNLTPQFDADPAELRDVIEVAVELLNRRKFAIQDTVQAACEASDDGLLLEDALLRHGEYQEIEGVLARYSKERRESS